MKRFRKVDFKPVFRLALAVFLWAAVLFLGYSWVFSDRKPPSETVNSAKEEVIGESTSEAKINSGSASPSSSPKAVQSGENAAATPTPSSLPQFILANEKNSSAKTEAAKEEPKGPEKQEILPYLKEYKEGGFSLVRGTVKFSVIANWEYTVDEVLLLMNFNGQDVSNSFRVIGSNNTMNFETYDKDGGSGFDELNYFVGEEKDYKGKKYDIKLSWDFEAKVPMKRLYVNGELIADSFPESVPTAANPYIYFGNITDLVITDEWESK